MVTTVTVRGIKTYTSKGHVYHYHRATNTRLEEQLGTAAFVTEVAALDAQVQRARAKPGTLAGVIVAYKGSKFWTDLAPKTQLSYDRAFAKLKPIEGMPLRKINREVVAGIRDRIAAKHGRWMANYVLTVMSLLFDTACERNWAKENPTKGVRKIRKDKHRPTANRPWEPQECRAVIVAAPPYLAVPIALAMFGGFRKSDVLTISPDAVKDGQVHHRTGKTGAIVSIPVHPSLANVLALAPAHDADTLAVNSKGEPWTESGFNTVFGRLVRRLEASATVKPGLTMHGLRHTLGTRLAEAGCEQETIAYVLGHKNISMTHHYTKTADRSGKVTAGFENVHVMSPLPRERDANTKCLTSCLTDETADG